MTPPSITRAVPPTDALTARHVSSRAARKARSPLRRAARKVRSSPRRMADPRQLEKTLSGAEPGGIDYLNRGSNVGRYVVLEPVGSGGMGVVYAAYDPELNRRIAL